MARVGGDGAGRAILSALVTAVRASAHITLWEDARLTGLVRDANGRVRGAILTRGERRVRVMAPAVILATGGIGGLYGRTTTPGALQGAGMALAWQAGAEILLVPSAFSPVTGAAHWETLLRARAIETGCYVLAAAQPPRPPPMTRISHSMSWVGTSMRQTVRFGVSPSLILVAHPLRGATP